VSQHLKVLLDCGLVSARNVGNTRIYQVSSTGFRGINLWLDQFWESPAP
jgi:DNA-binding transcriptional ArsR family regulator